jgi:hypothetical protein
MAGAWDWHRAALRSARHIALHATAIGRLGAHGADAECRRRIATWAVDSRTTPRLIRRALDDAESCGDLRPSDAFTLKMSYALIEQDLGAPHNPGREILLARWVAAMQSRQYQINPEQLAGLVDAWRFWRREPERSRRVIRLAIANWLACYERPPGQRPDPDPEVSGRFDFYAFGPDAPANARTLTPAALDLWLSTADDARELLGYCDVRSLRAKERANQRALVVLLAGELYRRDHGAAPPSDEALVGPYLKSLPDDGMNETTRAR